MERSKRALCIIYNKVLKKVDKKKRWMWFLSEYTRCDTRLSASIKNLAATHFHQSDTTNNKAPFSCENFWGKILVAFFVVIW
jgi:hypothetical protein